MHPRPCKGADAKLVILFYKKYNLFGIYNFLSYIRSMRKYIPYIFGAIALYAILKLKRGATIANRALFSIDKMSVDIKKRQINLILGILNPASGSIKINSVVGNLVLNGQSIASIENFTGLIVEGNAKSFLSLIMKPSGIGIINLAIDFVNAKKNKEKTSANVKFVGTANVDGIAIPINTTMLDV